MRILQVCVKPPFPKSDGGSYAMNEIAECFYSLGYSVKVFAFDTPGNHSANIDKVKSAVFSKKFHYETFPVDTRIKPISALINLFGKKPYHVQRFSSKTLENRIISILRKEKYDFIILETIYPCLYTELIRSYSKAKIILRAHNIEHLIWNRIRQNSKNPLKKIYLKWQQKRLAKFEKTVSESVDGIMSISYLDENWLKTNTSQNNLCVIPFSMDLEKIKPCPEKKMYTDIFHIGAMNWLPNIEGLRWFISHVVPKLHEKNPNIRLFLAGKRMPKAFFSMQDDRIVVEGEVDNAKDFICKHDIMIVPLFSGSGIRIKIIEGMTLGKVIISTSIGAEGIGATDGRELLIANTAEEFVEKIIFCIQNPDFCSEMAKNAILHSRKSFSRKLAMQKLDSFLQSF